MNLKPRTIALYQNIATPDWHTTFDFHERVEWDTRPGWVRVSEPVRVEFQPLSTQETIEDALRSLDAQEAKIRAEMAEKLKSVVDARAQLRALTCES